MRKNLRQRQMTGKKGRAIKQKEPQNGWKSCKKTEEKSGKFYNSQSISAINSTLWQKLLITNGRETHAYTDCTHTHTHCGGWVALSDNWLEVLKTSSLPRKMMSVHHSVPLMMVLLLSLLRKQFHFITLMWKENSLLTTTLDMRI